MTKRDVEKVSFEAALQELQALVAKLESGDETLEDSLKSFERGVALVRVCEQRLSAAEVRVSQLENGPDGPVESSLEPDA